MKIGVIGAGAVGAACIQSLILRGSAREIVIVDRTRKRAEAVATDMRYGAVLSAEVTVRDGDYADLAGASLVMITSGVNEKTGGATDRNDKSGRLKLLDKNVEIYNEIVPAVVRSATDAVLLVVTDPPDPLADLSRRLAGHDRVLSTGTFLDSLRFRVHLAKHFGVSAATVEALIVGEHGTSEVFVWSSARIAGTPVADLIRQAGEAEDAVRQAIEQEVRYANITIIEGNEASQYGIGMVCARLAEAVLRDENLSIPVGAFNPEYGVTLSLPSVLGARGVSRILPASLSEEERRLLHQSADTLRQAVARTQASA